MTLTIRYFKAGVPSGAKAWDRGLASAKLHASFDLGTAVADQVEIIDDGNRVVWRAPDKDEVA